MSHPRILFYVERNLHLPFLEPIFDLFSQKNDAEIAFSSPGYVPVTNEHIGIGLAPDVVEALRIKGDFFEDPQIFSPDIIVVADCCYFRLYDGPKFVNVGHGMICKGTFYNNSKIVRRENIADLICTPGEWHKNRLQEVVCSPIEVTGFIKSDQVYGENAPDRTGFLQALGIDPRKKVILFAPTYNENLSALPFIAERIGELAGPDTHVLIKLHGMTAPHWIEVCRHVADENQAVTLLGDDQYAGAFVSADVLLSDVSSIYVEFMGQDKPIILFNNPQRYAFNAFREDDIEYLVRDACYEVSSMEELTATVRKVLLDPTTLGEKRREYASRLDYGRDGRSAQRACDAILNLVKQRIKPVITARQTILVYVPEQLQGTQIRQGIDEIRSKTDGECEFIIFGPTMRSLGARGKKNCCVRIDELNPFALSLLIDTCRAQRIGFVVCGLGCLPRNWNRMLVNHFFWNKDTAIVSAICDSLSADQILAVCCPEMKNSSAPNKARFFKFITVGESMELETCLSSCFFFDTALLANPPKTPLGLEGVCAYLCEKAKESGLICRMACDTYVYSDKKSRVF